ncbi:hypothetical protein EHS13_13750 [Paenibacillus psychroresistens]|uniref:Uncharacterized protein n=1 Tax=Paenibacillus psychroresistens TaxID=1778678 RepID=A0A6B8RJX4_9BACL|nr:hypothetical protein [Paenibacillus psychroresistens]QGQ95863.1 hypothetical protein EHS13_13750 [Paenibacillus psychroresistens]
MNLREQIAKDIGTFINNNEFFEDHDVNGQTLSVMIDNDAFKGRSRQPTDLYNATSGVSIGSIILYVKESDMEDRPVIEQHLRLDGKLYLVSSCNENMGMLEIGLEANEA